MIGTDSYNYPFVNRDANTDSFIDIVNYWCEPTHIEISEMLYSDKALIIEGPKGCGKTTLFKYFSYKAQEALGETYECNLRKGKYICIYHRLGDYNYSSLDGKGLHETFWVNLFVHTFELKLSVMLLNMIGYYSNKESLETTKTLIVSELGQKNEFYGVETYENLIVKIEDYIRNVNDFIRQRSMMEVDFKPEYWFSYYEIVGSIVKVINNHIPSDKRFKVAFIIDEMENISESHQKAINTYIKFVKENISFRIGAKPAGIATYLTLTKEDIRENHDYNYIEINPYINTEKYEKFLIEIANKRLANSIYGKDKEVKIESLLGRKEDVLKEISNKISSDFSKHFDLLNKDISNEELQGISSDDKLKELLNIIKINRGESIEELTKQMESFNNKETNSSEYKKYLNAYTNKYKKSLAFLLLHLAGKRKSYYSLKTFTFLSSGSTRIFLQLCHKVFELAEFYNPDALNKNEMINLDLQTQAAIAVAESEMNYLKRVSPFGREMFNFVDNVCRLFQYYHRDIGLRYPETNQFTLDDVLDEIDKKIINIARKNAFIIRKKKLQQRSIGKPKTFIYTINRIFFPLYDISCVTRGGYNPKISNESMKRLAEGQLDDKTIVKITENKVDEKADYSQIRMEI